MATFGINSLDFWGVFPNVGPENPLRPKKKHEGFLPSRRHQVLGRLREVPGVCFATAAEVVHGRPVARWGIPMLTFIWDWDFEVGNIPRYHFLYLYLDVPGS